MLCECVTALFIVEVHLAMKLVHRHATFNNLKETIPTYQKHYIRNPNWQEVTSWLFTKHGRVESGATRNKSKPELRTGFEPGSTAFKPNALTNGPHHLSQHNCLQAVILRINLNQDFNRF